MKTVNVLLFIVLIILPQYAADGKKQCHLKFDHDLSCLEDVDLDFKNGSLFIRNHNAGKSVVEITEEYELYVNGRHVETGRKDRRMLKEYYHRLLDLLDFAKEIGYEGAKIGLQGAAVGLQAVSGILVAVLTDYELEDLEDDLDYEAEKLESKAERLEKKAELLEDLSEEIEDLHDELRDRVPELRELDWF